MQITLTCPNPECETVLRVAAGLGGKRIQCPRCHHAVSVPISDSEDEQETRTQKEAPIPRVRQSPSDLMDDSDKESADDFPRLVKRIRGLTLGSGLAYFWGMLLLGWVIYVPFTEWLIVSGGKDGRTARLTLTGLGDAKIVSQAPRRAEETVTGTVSHRVAGGMALLVVASVLVGILLSIFLYALIRGRKSDATNQAMQIGSFLGTAAGILMLIWGLALIWRTISVSKTPTLESEKSVSVSFNFSLYLMVAAGVVMMILFSKAMKHFGERVWIGLAQGLGLVLGGVVVWWLKPWDGELFFNNVRGALLVVL